MKLCHFALIFISCLLLLIAGICESKATRFYPSVAPQELHERQQWIWGSLVAKGVSKTPQTQDNGKCGFAETKYKDECFPVLQQFPCDNGQWLVEEDEEEGTGRCVENKCQAHPNTGFFGGKCVQIKSEEFCPKGMRIHIYKNGKVDCDCKEGFIYNVKDGQCHEAFRQGPCKQFQVFMLISNSKRGTTQAMCQQNPCRKDGYFCNKCETRKNFYWNAPKGLYPMPTNCVKFGSPCTPDGRGVFVIHPQTNQPYCQEDLHDGTISMPVTRIIGNVPILKCALGSRRDILGNCRTPTTIDFS